MAAANGTLTPPSLPPAPASPSLAKRKRSETDAIVSNGASTAAATKTADDASHSLQSVLEAVLSVLKSYDTDPSILTHPITSCIARASSGESDSKRAKLTPPDGPTTIADLVNESAYDSLLAFEKDTETASSEILASIGGGERASVQLSLEETRLQSKVLAFQKILRSLVSREQARREHIYGKKQPKQDITDEGADGEEKQEKAREEGPEPRTVLTLYGTAQGPKQLFSSLQAPQRIPPNDEGASSGMDLSVKINLPLRESTLPNMLSTTQVYPLPEEEGDKKKSRTLGEVFPIPSHLPQLSPPKLAKPTTGKGNTITFAPPEIPKPSRKSSHSYANQNLSTGYWLGYGGVDMPKDPTSPTAKQKSRQRALSMGEGQQPPSEATLVAIQQAKEDALFRSAYSSFAPTRDDATAIIPEETKNRVWWQKVGEKRFNDLFPIDPALLGETEGQDAEDAAAEDEEFKEAVENFTPIELDPILVSSEKSELERDTEEVLQEISELLETLASHQRIRNSSLATNPRTPVIQNSSLASLAGSPATPSTEEIDIYQMLKSQLTLLISQLPPYAVAKLNGDQLEELNISRTILIENRDYSGVLEEDQFSRAAKAPTMPVGAGTPSLQRMASGSSAHSHYPAATPQYARTPSIHQPSARPGQPPQSYYPQQQALHRSPSVHQFQRSSSSQGPAYPASTPSYANNTPRQSFPATQAYGQQTPRPSYGQAAPGQYYGQRSSQPSNYGGAASSQFFQSTPQPQAHGRYPPQAQNGFFQRSQPVAPMHNYGAAQSPHARTASPLKANPPASQAGFGGHAGYGTPVSGGQLRSTYYGPSQYGTPQTPNAAAGAAPPGGYPNHQQMMLERQQAAQSQARLAAQNNFNNRQGSGTPQPPPNGQYGGQQSNQASSQPSNGAMVT
ncbi:hypothetical protein BS50DRAFT_624315 [Corynespora cassiicola Philippines]|uniref:Uncharacterized protein n=1 Tax=Corynespora cassiicola Philippines TaxID=1448308 RepID=A0A2T2NAP8_CORCC|nr:hypothetical protein BS50DRAFT_624315 [Corynespora cassiicola Philippines]